MPIQVQVGEQTVEFPDGTSREDMDKALRERFAPKPQSSSLGAGLRSFASGLGPTGAAVGTEALLAPETLGASLLAMIPTVAAGYGANKLQQAGIHKFAPKFEQQQQADVTQHPIATSVGSVASAAPFLEFSPGALFKNPKAAVLPASIGATVGAVQPLLEGQKPTLKDLAEGAATAALFKNRRFQLLPRAKAATARAIGDKANAEAIRSDTGQVHERGQEQEVLPREGGENLQQQAPQQPSGTQGEARPQQTGELGLTDEEADYLEQERQGLDAPLKIVPRARLTSGVDVESSPNAQVPNLRGTVPTSKEGGLLPQAPRSENERVAQDAQINALTANENERSQLRARVRQTGENPEEALRALRQSQQPNPPPGLQQTPAGQLALPSVSPEPASENEPFAASQIARPNRKTGTIEVNGPEFSRWLKDIPPKQKAQAVRSLLAEERIHLGVSDQQAGDYWNNLTALEKAAERKAYTNDWRGLHPDTGERISDTLMGHEAVRRRLQQLARMPTTEVAALVGRERLSLQAIEALSRTVRAIREGIGTKASREQLAIIDHIQNNLDAAKAAAAQQPAALRRPRKGEERNQPTFELPGYAPGQETERPTAEQMGAASKHAAEGTIHPEDLYFRDEPSPEEGLTDITERKKRQDRLRGQAIVEIPEELRGNVKRLNSLLTQDSRVSGGNVEDTRRLTALVNKKTDEVALVSTFLRGQRGERAPEAWVRNPNPAIEGNKRLSDVLSDWTPTHSFLSQEARDKFIQTFPDLKSFSEDFVEPSKEVLEGRLGAPEPLSDAPYWPGQGRSATAKLGAPITASEGLLGGSMTPSDALSIIEHARGESGEIDSPQDIVSSMDAVTADVRRGTGVGPSQARRAYAQLLAEVDRKYPELSNEQKEQRVAQFVFDSYKTSPDHETFVRRIVEATGRPYLPGAQAGVPQGVGQPAQAVSGARELTTPRFARKAVPTEPYAPQPRPTEAAPPSTLGTEFPRRQALTEGFPDETLPPLLKRPGLTEGAVPQAEKVLRAQQEGVRRAGDLPLTLTQEHPAALNARVKAAKDELSVVGDNLKAIYQRRGTKQNIARGVDAQDNAAKTIASKAKDAIILDSGEDISKPTQSNVLARGIRAHSAEVKGKRSEALKRREASLAVKSSMEGPGPGQEVPNLNKLNMFEMQTRQGLIKAERASKSINPIERRQGRKDIEYGNRLLEGIEYARSHWNDPAFQDAAQSFVREMDDELLTENANGLDVNWRSGQVPGYYENDGFFSDKNVIFNRRGILGTAFGKPKVFKDIYEAFATGGHFRLASLDSADIANHRISRGQYAIGQQKTIQQLKRMRDPVSKKPILMDMQPIMEKQDVTGPMVGPGGVVTQFPATVQTSVSTGRFKVPEGHPEYTPIEIGTGARVAVRRGYEGFVKSVFGHSGLSDLKIGEVPVGQAAMQLSQVLKHQVIALFDTFHPGRMLQYATALKAGPKYEGGWAATHYREADLQRAVNQGYITQDAADWALEQHPVKLGPRTQMKSMHWIINNLLVKEGLNSAHNRDVLLEASTAHLPIVGESWQKLLRPYNVGLFEHLIPGLMNEAAGRRFVEMQAKHPDIPAKKLARDIIKDTNVFFGNMGRQGIFQNKLFSDLATTTFFAPRWLEGLVQKELRFASRATGLSYLLGRREPSYFGMLGEGMAKGLGAYFIGTQILNLISRAHFTWDNPEEDHKMDAYIKPPWSKDGFWLSPMSVFAEVTHDIIRLSESKPRVLDALKQFAENRLGPIGKMEQILRTGRSPTGEQYSTSLGELGGAASQLAPAPISFGPLARGLGHSIAPNLVSPQLPGTITRQAIAGSLGVKAEREKSPLQQIAAKARDFAEKEGYSKETGWKEIMTDEPSYSKLRLALRNDDQKEAVRQWSELRKTHSEQQIVHAMKLWAKKPLTGSAKGERAFIYSLDNRDLERYWQANQQRQTELEKFYDFYTRQ